MMYQHRNDTLLLRITPTKTKTDNVTTLYCTYEILITHNHSTEGITDHPEFESVMCIVSTVVNVMHGISILYAGSSVHNGTVLPVNALYTFYGNLVTWLRMYTYE
jgi:hypothetical protein